MRWVSSINLTMFICKTKKYSNTEAAFYKATSLHWLCFLPWYSRTAINSFRPESVTFQIQFLSPISSKFIKKQNLVWQDLISLNWKLFLWRLLQFIQLITDLTSMASSLSQNYISTENTSLQLSSETSFVGEDFITPLHLFSTKSSKLISLRSIFVLRPELLSNSFPLIRVVKFTA